MGGDSIRAMPKQQNGLRTLKPKRTESLTRTTADRESKSPANETRSKISSAIRSHEVTIWEASPFTVGDADFNLPQRPFCAERRTRLSRLTVACTAYLPHPLGAIRSRCVDPGPRRRTQLYRNLSTVRSPVGGCRPGSDGTARWAQFWAQRETSTSWKEP